MVGNYASAILSESSSFVSINCPDFALSTSYGADAGEMTIPGVGEGMAGVEGSSVFWMVAEVD